METQYLKKEKMWELSYLVLTSAGVYRNLPQTLLIVRALCTRYNFFLSFCSMLWNQNCLSSLISSFSTLQELSIHQCDLNYVYINGESKDSYLRSIFLRQLAVADNKREKKQVGLVCWAFLGWWNWYPLETFKLQQNFC